MKKSVKVSLSFLAVSTAIVASFVLGQRTTADERKVYIPDVGLRGDVVEKVKWNPETGEEEVIENELPTVDQMARLDRLDIVNVKSLEGLQYAGNITYLSYFPQANDVIDFRPVSEMENLEEFFIHAPENDPSKPLDISAFSGLRNLKNIDFNYYVQVFDFSPLSNIESLERIHATGFGMAEFPEVYVDRATKELVMRHPVTYSTQLSENRSVTAWLLDADGGFVRDIDVVLDGNRITVSDLDEHAAKIEFSFIGHSEDGCFYAQSNCSMPIVWY